MRRLVESPPNLAKIAQDLIAKGLNHGYAYRERIARAGATVLEHLAQGYRHATVEEWRERIDRGEVELDGLRAAPDSGLQPGQTLVWHRPPWDEPEVDPRYTVLLEDEAVVAVAKPRGLPTVPGGGFLEHTLLTLVRADFPGASPMHRLGRETSGIVLFARTSGAGASLQRAWRAHQVLKRYRALGAGVAAQDDYDLNAPIGPVPHPVLGTLHVASAAGKPSRSRARVLERRERSTLFEVDIDTGRPHQIRIHLAFAGHPLVGDPLYVAGGVPGPDRAALPGEGGYFLHAAQLVFPHPSTGLPTDLTASPPAELCCAGES